MGEVISKAFDLNEKEESQVENRSNNVKNKKLKKEDKIIVLERSIIINSDKEDRYNLGDIDYLNYIDILESLIFFYKYKMIFLKYPSLTRIIEYENIVNTKPVFYFNYQINSNKLYLNYENKDVTNIFLIQKKSIKLLEEIIPLEINDLIEISSIKIIVLDRKNSFCSCFELKNKEYQKIKIFGEDENEIYSIRKCPQGNYFFVLKKEYIQVYDSQTLELINIIYIENDDICFVNYHYFIILKSYYKLGYSRIFLVDLNSFKILNRQDSGYENKDLSRLQSIGNKQYFIASRWTNVSKHIIMEVNNNNNNKIYYIKNLKENDVLPFNASLYFNDTIVIGGDNKIFIFKLHFK